MKLNIEIDLTDFYAENFDYDSDLGASPNTSLSGEIAQLIKGEVRNAISRQVRDEVKKIANAAFLEFGQEKIKSIVEFKMNEFLVDGNVKKDNYSQEMIPISEKLRSIFDSSNEWSRSYVGAMEKIGKGFADECRKRYDMVFASNIVTGLEKQGLLKDGVFEAITHSKEG